MRLQLDRPMEFQAGQYINVQFPGIEGTRAFSIANTPSELGIIELHIRHVVGGSATTYVHEQLAAGDALEISGPYGQFLCVNRMIRTRSLLQAVQVYLARNL